MGNDDPITKPRIDRTDCWHFKNDASVVESLYISDPNPPHSFHQSIHIPLGRPVAAAELKERERRTRRFGHHIPYIRFARLVAHRSRVASFFFFYRSAVCADFVECPEVTATVPLRESHQSSPARDCYSVNMLLDLYGPTHWWVPIVRWHCCFLFDSLVPIGMVPDPGEKDSIHSFTFHHAFMIGWVRVPFNERGSDGLAEKVMQEEPWDHFLQSYETGSLFVVYGTQITKMVICFQTQRGHFPYRISLGRSPHSILLLFGAIFVCWCCIYFRFVTTTSLPTECQLNK